MAKSIIEIWGMSPVNMVNAGQYYKGMTDLIETVDSDIEVGIEVEVENHEVERRAQPVWVMKGDGSLRNNGVEWITHPIQARWAPHALKDLLVDSISKGCCFSPRTSIHVHFNVQKLEAAKVVDIVLMYTLLEPLFYKFTGRGRIKNIYCVPLMDTNLITGMCSNPFTSVVESWSKYTGLNILPLRELGTIEARHMHGTFDHRKVSIWIRLWTKLIDYCNRNSTTDIRRLLLELHGMTDYQHLLVTIFGQDDAMQLKYESFRDLERSVNVVKQAFINPATNAILLKQISKKSLYLGVA